MIVREQLDAADARCTCRIPGPIVIRKLSDVNNIADIVGWACRRTLGAHYGRWALGKILADWINDGTVEAHEALEIAQHICFRNALGLYRLDSSWLGGTMAAGGTSANAS